MVVCIGKSRHMVVKSKMSLFELYVVLVAISWFLGIVPIKVILVVWEDELSKRTMIQRALNDAHIP